MPTIFEAKRDEKLAEKAALLVVFRDKTQYAAERAEAELPLIQSALVRADAWIKENIGAHPETLRLPLPISNLIVELDRLRNVPNTVPEALTERNNKITASALWSSRGSGEREPHRLSFVINDLVTRLSCARGCAGAIDRIVLRLDAEVKRAAGYVPGTAAETVEVQMPQPKAAATKVDSKFDLDEPVFKI